MDKPVGAIATAIFGVKNGGKKMSCYNIKVPKGIFKVITSPEVPLRLKKYTISYHFHEFLMVNFEKKKKKKKKPHRRKNFMVPKFMVDHLVVGGQAGQWTRGGVPR